MTKLRIAILDDYNDLAPGHISDLLGDADITIYRDTILPHPDPKPLLERLRPYDVLVTMRERTPLPAEVIAGLPQLKIVLTTGMHNRGIDLEACKARGVIVAGPPAAPSP
jgi:phosphoglycerate dehydrogenase-like enzyme